MVRHVLLSAAAVVTLASACSSASSGGSSSDDPSPVTAAPVGDLGDAVEVMAGAPAAADAAGCDLDLTTLEAAVEMYELMVGEPPATQNDLIAEGFLREPSPRFELDANGAVVPIAAGPCA